MTAVRVGAAIGLAGLAVVAALVAADIRACKIALASGDAVYTSAPAQAEWKPSTYLGGAAARVLGVDTDFRLRSALRLYRVSAAVPARLDTEVEAQSLRAEARTALAAVAASSDESVASQALTLLGVLDFEAPAASGAANETSTAITDFTAAVKDDPQNTEAKLDLELLLRLTAAHGSRPGSGPSNGFGRGGRRGAGGGVPGSGY